MKKVTLSVMAVLALSGAAAANTLTLYTDTATGQVYTTPGEGRVEMGDFVDAKTVYKENQAQDSAIAKKEASALKKGKTPVYSKASKLKFSGTHYLGYRYSTGEKNSKYDDSWSGFETRRNYFQVKAYMFDNPKSYMRVTLDTFENTGDTDSKDEDSWEVRLKYAYLYLDNILPFTGVEFGQVHRPWIDYEEHQGWWYRSISKVFVEAGEAAHLTNSADQGINFKTKTPYFTSEVGMFNGEGYHSHENGDGNSLEWRATAALTGNGDQKRKPLKDTYWDASFFGQYNMENGKNNDETFTMMGLHTVYNMPSFLIAAQYVTSDSDSSGAVKNDMYVFEGEGYSLNGTFRFGNSYRWELLGRYDAWTKESATSGVDDIDSEYGIAGVGYQYNKNVKFIGNVLYTEPDTDTDDDDYMSYMFTAEVHW